VPHALRFGIHLWELPSDDWAAKVRHYEDMGFSVLTFTDHVIVPQWEPVAALGAVSAVTDRLRVGTLVLDAALRNPVLTAKAAATLEMISGGRLELGLGAGYVASNFAAAGMPFEGASHRVGRLEESVELMRMAWAQPSTTFHGRYFHVTDVPMVASRPVDPWLLIGGGGSRVMHFAGRVADTASMIPRQTSGEWSVRDSLPDSNEEQMLQKARWVREGAKDAGRDGEEIELNVMVPRVIVGADVRRRIESETADTGITAVEMAASFLYLCGSGEDVCTKVERWRDTVGVSYISLFDPGEEQIEYLCENVMRPLSGR
jgi:probable F420-dependent oxidoreductase